MSIDDIKSDPLEERLIWFSPDAPKMKFNGVLVAGTFDRLHKGHILLLNAAVSSLRNGGLLTVGLTDGKLIQNKYLSLLIEPFDARKKAVEKIIHDHCKEYDVDVNTVSIRFVSISERYPQNGLTNDLLEAIVVSEETKKEAIEFNRKRRELGVMPLHIILVDIVSENEAGEVKLSSSQLRECDLGTFLPIKQDGDGSRNLRRRQSEFNLRPYRIGLTGNIASGKSTVAKLLSKFGAKTVDCDLLAHKCYLQGAVSYFEIIDKFGESILNEDKSINRAALGQIVFGDAAEMKKLTETVWPRVANLKSEIFDDMSANILSEWNTLSSSSSSSSELPFASFDNQNTHVTIGADDFHVEICVAEAALMIESKSFVDFDELWFVFTTHNVACERLMSRNGISLDEAEKRIRSQMNMSEKIKYADVAIYNGKDHDYLHQQVSKAWNLLLERSKQRVISFLEKRDEIEKAEYLKHYVRVRFHLLCEKLGLEKKVAKNQWMTLIDEYKNHFDDLNALLDYLKSVYSFFHEYFHFIEHPEAFELALYFYFISVNNDKRTSYFQEFLRNADIKFDKTHAMDLLGFEFSNLVMDPHSLPTTNHNNNFNKRSIQFWFSNFLLAALIHLDNSHFAQYLAFLLNCGVSSTSDPEVSLSTNERAVLLLKEPSAHGMALFANPPFPASLGSQFREKIETALT